MSSSTSNIEPLARDISERDFRRAGIPQESLSADIDRYWHCVAAQIEAGFIDDNNELVPYDLIRVLRLIATGAPAILTMTFRRCASRRPLHDRSRAREGEGD